MDTKVVLVDTFILSSLDKTTRQIYKALKAKRKKFISQKDGVSLYLY